MKIINLQLILAILSGLQFLFRDFSIADFIISFSSFKKTESMAALLEERQKRQREKRDNEMDANSVRSKKIGVSDSRDLQSLVESVKRKSLQSEVAGQGKRRKL
jgi:hypothetical protein